MQRGLGPVDRGGKPAARGLARSLVTLASRMAPASLAKRAARLPFQCVAKISKCVADRSLLNTDAAARRARELCCKRLRLDRAKLRGFCDTA